MNKITIIHGLTLLILTFITLVVDSSAYAISSLLPETGTFGASAKESSMTPTVIGITEVSVQTAPALREICGDGIDDNSNGQIDEECNFPPDCSTAAPDPSTLLFPDHHMEEVTIKGAIDPNNDPVILTIINILQDEPTVGLESNDQTPDAVLVDGDTVQLRAERAENGDGRIFYISFRAYDGKDGVCEGVVSVSVPLDQRLGFAVDSGTYFSSLQ